MKRILIAIALTTVVVVVRGSGSEGRRQHRLTVATDAELFASSGEILSREDQERMAMERMIRERLAMRAQEVARDPIALSERRSDTQVKPGNPINVRVIDPDRCVSDQPDTVYVRVEASSGDYIRAFPLKETGPFTGVFEGQVPTDRSPAVAYATDSDEGRDPVFPISAGDYPPWVARPDNIRPKRYTVDLFDNIASGQMRIVSDVPGRRLNSFVLLASLDATTFEALGSYPAHFEAWDGSPRVEAARVAGTDRSVPQTVESIREYLATGFVVAGEKLIYSSHNGFNVNWGNNAGGLAGDMNLSRSGEGSWYVARFSGGFYMDDRRPRTFELVPSTPPGETIQYFFFINGEPPTAAPRGEPPNFEISRVLSRGVHTIDVFVVAQRDTGPAFEIRQNIPEPPYMETCPPEMFDIAVNPLIAEELARKPATITPNEERTQFDVTFDAGTRMRMFRLDLFDFESDAPSISRIALVDRENKRILPTEQDLPALRDNMILELVSGDRITITYEDPVVVTEGRNVHQVHLAATFHNATVSASFIDIGYDGRGQRIERFIPMRRFEPGDAITVFVRDPDEDVTSEPDTVDVTVGTRLGKPKTIKALETGNHTGVFTARIFPVTNAATRAEEIQVMPGDDLVISFMDRENTNPGIPWRRTFVTEQIWYQEPELRVYDIFSQEVPEDQRPARTDAERAPEGHGEQFPDPRDIVVRRPENLASPDDQNHILIGTPVIAEIVFPTIAKSPICTTDIFMQTRSAREKVGLGEPEPGTFDKNVPGTIKRTVTTGGVRGFEMPPGYRSQITVTEGLMGDALQDGRFTFTVPTELGEVPDDPLIDVLTLDGTPPPLTIRGDDTVYIGYRYVNDRGQTNWLTHQVSMVGDHFFDVMDRRYQMVVDSSYVGETIYLRVIDPRQDVSSEQDVVDVRMVTSSGAQQDVSLMETMPHSGVFRGHVRLVYAEVDDPDMTDPFTFPVKYGDRILAGYRPPAGGEIVRREVTVHKGSDGEVLPFTKRFEDDEIAVQTQFAMAEAYFELAKRQRQMGQEDLARRQIAQGRRLLEEALRDFPDTDRRVQADYLLAELAFEFGKDAVNEEVKRRYYLDALDQYSSIISRFPDTIYAPRAQYKRGLVYEEMGRIQQAAEEFVSLSYRYPDNELIAETIARLGQFFLTMGRERQESAEARTDPIEREKEMMEARATYVNAGNVFVRLRERFPEHALAIRTTVLAGQSYMRAEEYGDAIAAFEPVASMSAQSAEQAELIAEAMFWTGEAYMRRGAAGDMPLAYQTYTKLTWDYPASRWARFARGRLASTELSRMRN